MDVWGRCSTPAGVCVICPSRAAWPVQADGHDGNACGRSEQWSESRSIQLLQQSSPPLLQLPFTQLAAWRIPAALNATPKSWNSLAPTIKKTDFRGCKEGNSECDPQSSRQPTSSLAAFLFGDFCLESERDFPRDLSFSFSFSRSFSRFPSRSLPFFSLSESGDAWLLWVLSVQIQTRPCFTAFLAYLQTCDASSWSSSCASWTFYSFSLEVSVKVVKADQTSDLSRKGHSPDSPLEERSEGDLDWDLFFFLW